MILRRENDLAVLRIRLDRRGFGRTDGSLGSAVVFELVVGSTETVELTRTPPERLGIPQRGLVEARHDVSVSLPKDLLEDPSIRDATSGRSALWLELPAPSGPLRWLAWEEALAPLDVPVLRLPYFALRPVSTDGQRTIAICASSPAAKGAIDLSAEVLRVAWVTRKELGDHTRIHVFTDETWADSLQSAGLHVHDPRSAAPYAVPERSSEIGADSTLQNPWTQWMRDQLAGTAVDHVHFLCHGFLAADGGAVAVAPSPLANDDRRISRFVGVNESVALLSALGAWSVGYTGPSDNYSRLGLRALADAVAEARPGPVLAHETVHDRDFAELGRALALAIGPSPVPTPRPGRAALWIHPQRVQQSPYPVEAATAPGDDLLDDASWTSSLFGPATTAALASPDTPGWVASSARVLEQAQATWLSATQTGLGDVSPDPEWTRQATDALQQACHLLEEQVKQSGGQP